MADLHRNLVLAFALMLSFWTEPLLSQQAPVMAQKIIPPCPCYSIRVSPMEQTVTIGDPVAIEVVLTNTVDHDIYVDQNSHHPSDLYFVDVKDTNGVRQKMTSRYSEITALLHAKESGMAQSGLFRSQDGTIHIYTYRGSGEALRIVKPNETVKDTFPLNDLYVFDKSGTYSVQLKQAVGKEEIDSNVVTIKMAD
jgi:hypothetical protein